MTNNLADIIFGDSFICFHLLKFVIFTSSLESQPAMINVCHKRSIYILFKLYLSNNNLETSCNITLSSFLLAPMFGFLRKEIGAPGGNLLV